MWYGIMKEFNRKATSAWSKCGRAKETAFTHKHLGQKKQEETSQLDNIVGTGRRDDDVYICNDVRLWDMWDHYPIFARIQEEEQTESFPKGKRRRSGQDGNQRQTNKKTNLRKKKSDGG